MVMKRTSKAFLAVLTLFALLCSLVIVFAHAALPETRERRSDVLVFSNAKASVDASNSEEGYVTVKYLGGKNVKLKLKIVKAGGTDYTYDLNSDGRAETFPFTEGDGAYTVSIFENVSGNKYSQAFSCTVNVKLRNPFLPYLYSNQYVNYTPETKAVVQAEQLTASLKDRLEIVKKIYDYVVTNYTYDTELAQNVQSGYLPVLDKITEARKGICFDYAALMSAMLRSRGIPCKLVIGYVGEVYHAWINVYIDGVGWIDKVIFFDGVDWSLMDPTFASSLGANSSRLASFIGDGTNYTAKYAY